MSIKDFIRSAKKASKRLKVVVPNGKGSYTFGVRAPYSAVDPQKRIVMVASVEASSRQEAESILQTKLQASDLKYWWT
jgi:hypothetical protein